MGERKPQPFSNVDFRPKDVVHLSLDHIRGSCELGARGREGNKDLRGEGILPPKGIYVRISERLELGNNIIMVHARENFPGR